MSNNFNRKLTIWILINIFYVFTGSYLFASELIKHKYFSLGFIPLLIINIIIIIFILKKKIYKKNISYIFLFLLVILGIIATIFAVNKEVSLLGFNNRDEGLFIIIYYLSLTFISSFIKKDNKKSVILFILITGIVQALYAICQIYNLPFVCIAHNPELNGEIWATGFIKNPNFFGTYILICLCYSLGLYINEESKKKKIYLFLISILFTYGLVISNALSCVIGIIVSYIYLSVYGIKNKKYKKLICIFIMIISVTLLTSLSSKTTLLKDIETTKKQSIEISKGNIDDSYGTKRLFIWKNTIKIVPKNLLHGVGIDNFYYAFDGGHLTYKNGINTYDKAHNEYLQLLVTQGIFALIIYLLLCFKIIYSKTKRVFKDKEIYIILPIIGYLNQAFFNISVIEVAPIFFIGMGLSIVNKNDYKLLD